MINPYSFTGKIIKMGFKNNLDSSNNIHAFSILCIVLFFTDFGIETRFSKKILKKWLLFTLE